MILNDSLIQNGSILLNNGSINLTVNFIAENFTGDGMLVSDSSIWSQVLNPFFILSFMISIITLWLSHLRGARISLVEKPKIQLNDLPDEEFKPDYIPRYLGIKNIDLFFINSGNRAGIVKDFQDKIVLKDNVITSLEPYITIKYGKNPENEQGLVIPDRSGGQVVITYLGFHIKGLTKGEFNKFESIEENENLVEIIEAIFYKQRRDLEQFIKLIHNKKTFAQLEISYQYSGGKYWIREGIKQEKFDLQIENQYESTIEKFEKYLIKYDNLSPTINDVISKLTLFLSYCRDIIEQNKNGLLEMKAPQSLHNRNYMDALKEYSFQNNLLEKWKKSKSFAKELDKAFILMNNYTDISDKASKYKMDVDKEEWNKCKDELIEQCHKIIPELELLVNELQDIHKNISLTKKN